MQATPSASEKEAARRRAEILERAPGQKPGRQEAGGHDRGGHDRGRHEPANPHAAIQAEPAAVPTTDTGLQSLLLLIRFHGLPADEADLRHRHTPPGGILGPNELLRAARETGLKAKWIETDWSRLARTPLPALVPLRDGSHAILAGHQPGSGATGKNDETQALSPQAGQEDGTVLLKFAGERQPRSLSRKDFETIWSGRLMLLAKRATTPAGSRFFDITWFVPTILKYRKLLGEVFVASFFMQILALVTPLFFQVVIDKVLVHRSLTTLDVIIIGLAIISLFEILLSAMRSYVFSHTTNRVDVELGAGLFRHLLALPLPYFQVRRVGDSVARARELENIRSFLTGSALTLAIDLMFTTVFLAVMWYYSPTLTAIVIGAIPAYVILSIVVTPGFRRRLEEKFARGAENQSFLVESITGVETAKALAVEPRLQRKWEEQLAAYVSAAFKVNVLGNWASHAAQAINKATILLTLYFGAKAVIAGDLTVGSLVAFNMLAGQVHGPVLRLAQMWQDFQQVRISVNRLGDILNAPAEPLYQPDRQTPPALKGAISFEHVHFRYRPDAPEVISDLNLKIEAGQTIGVVGSSGSGKSTLTRLINRLQAPERGRILIDGTDLSLANPTWLRRQVGMVLQENVLFSGTIRENIAFVDPSRPMAQVIEAAKLAGAHDFIIELPDGYETRIGERGASLSGGQRQRIAIARALFANPRILIFDEATSALDYESERIIQDNMSRIAAGRTVIIIAHRLSAVRHADRILTLEKGRLVEDGSHDDLIKAGGRYAQLHAYQNQGSQPGRSMEARG